MLDVLLTLYVSRSTRTVTKPTQSGGSVSRVVVVRWLPCQRLCAHTVALVHRCQTCLQPTTTRTGARPRLPQVDGKWHLVVKRQPPGLRICNESDVRLCRRGDEEEGCPPRRRKTPQINRLCAISGYVSSETRVCSAWANARVVQYLLL